MTTNLTERLLQVGNRLLQNTDRLCQLPRQDGLLAAWETLSVDPMMRLTERLQGISDCSRSHGARLEPMEQGYGSTFASVPSEESRSVYAMTHSRPFNPNFKGAIAPPSSSYPLASPKLLAQPNAGGAMARALPTIAHPVALATPHDLNRRHRSISSAAGRSEGERGKEVAEENFTGELFLPASTSPQNLTDQPQRLSLMLPPLTGVFYTMAALNIPIPGTAKSTVKFDTNSDFIPSNRRSLKAPSAVVGERRRPLFSLAKQPNPADRVNGLKRDAVEQTLAVGGGLKASIPAPPVIPQGVSTNLATSGGFGISSQSKAETSPRLGTEAAVSPTSPANGLHIAQNASAIARVLQANLSTNSSLAPGSSVNGRIDSSSLPVSETTESLSEQPQQKVQADLENQLNLEEFIEKLADRLEFEFIRTYGTSGR